MDARDATLPIHVPLLRASCDGSGACCGIFHHVPVTSADRRQIEELLSSHWDGPLPLADLFFPAFPGHDEPLGVVEVDGNCALLGSDGLCRVHAAGGAQAKPQSCLSFPAELVACGDEWHASLRPECACIARTAITGAPLQDEPATWAALRSAMVRVWEVPETIRIDGSRSIGRGEYLGWMRETMAALKTTFEPLPAFALAVERLSGAHPGSRPPGPWLDSVARDLRKAADRSATTHPPASAWRRSVEWGAEVSAALAGGADPEPGWSRGQEQHQARLAASVVGLLLHGHALLHHPLLARAAGDLCWLLWLARAACAVRPPEEVDPRLETWTTWIFLWRHVGWSA